jgi:dTDP-4-amino-4,6-dideoxygalactose transaminase
VHYAGIACDMDNIISIAKVNNIPVIEDAAQAIDSFHNGRPLGSLGVLGAFSFHETKNIISGEGGMIAVNDESYFKRAEIIREKGTNRSAFFRGEIDKYGWVDIGSSFLPSDITAAYLFAQLENLEIIQGRRLAIWGKYLNGLDKICKEKGIRLPYIPNWATNNAHMFYLVTNSIEERTKIIEYLRTQGVNSVFHYLSLHSSPYFINEHDDRILPNTDDYMNCLVRLPLYVEMTDKDVDKVIECVAHALNS